MAALHGQSGQREQLAVSVPASLPPNCLGDRPGPRILLGLSADPNDACFKTRPFGIQIHHKDGRNCRLNCILNDHMDRRIMCFETFRREYEVGHRDIVILKNTGFILYRILRWRSILTVLCSTDSNYVSPFEPV